MKRNNLIRSNTNKITSVCSFSENKELSLTDVNIFYVFITLETTHQFAQQSNPLLKPIALQCRTEKL